MIVGGASGTNCSDPHWSESDKDSHIEIVNGYANNDTLAQNQSSDGVWSGVRSTTSKSSGKWYFEVQPVIYALDSGWIVGLANSSAALATTDPGTTNNSVALQLGNGSAFQIRKNSVHTSYTHTIAEGDVWGIAVDRDNNLLWVNDWTQGTGWTNGTGGFTGNPAAGTNGNGYSISSISGALFAAFWGQNNSGNTDQIIINGYGPFVGTVPTGFSSWGPRATSCPTSIHIGSGGDFLAGNETYFRDGFVANGMGSTGQFADVQGNQSYTSGSTTSAAVTWTAGAIVPDAAVLSFTYSGASSAETPTIADDKGDMCVVSKTVFGGSNNKLAGVGYCLTLTAGAKTFTLSFPGGASRSAITLWADEFPGIGGFDKAGGQAMSPGGTATDGITSGTIAIGANELLLGVMVPNAGTDALIAQGTNFTTTIGNNRLGNNCRRGGARAGCVPNEESRVPSTSGFYAATWTAGTPGTDTYLAVVQAFTKSAAATDEAAVRSNVTNFYSGLITFP